MIEHVVRVHPSSERLPRERQLAFAMAGHDAARQEKLDQRTAAMIAELRVSKEGREGMQAFLDKREPDWAKGG